ncbi:7-cyano-7-deazaguanine synthase [Bradyrhizobium sacchari]|uniref:7-cyano-7-deazaguanine synthase n=1 Tax=Bradyrhizobium sacchari TaxID=1399419 RepID=A0A560HW20_9BRAD|nr:7-cyano-7-deazaguanine synthase [Bradyrhizobium sacchari]TWB50803.1 7-cyano-7-deazaguanine synthase [Bradyrhizobium sacchari]TWB68989.1 7-cyano-7-deazaguanine synthase [Bradyrhizobium sacchari]
MTPVLLLASGGLDSTTVAYWLHEKGETILPIFFDYGQHCVETEWATLHHVLPKTRVIAPRRIDISGIFCGSKSRLIAEPNLWLDNVDDSDLYIPYRTLLFFSCAAAVAQTVKLTQVYSGFINSNHAKELDCSATFLNSLDALAENVGPVRFNMPFRDKTKTEIVELARGLEVPIGSTFSCQVYSDIPCGACPNCVERIKAIEGAGLAT